MREESNHAGEHPEEEKLPAQVWVTMLLFAALVVGASGCIIGLLTEVL